MAFAENLAALPPIDHLARLEIAGADGRRETIENRPGSQGSLRVYSYLLGKYGRLDAAAARDGLSLFAEHSDDARRNPGRHPNIDRLLAIVDGAPACSGRVVTHDASA